MNDLQITVEDQPKEEERRKVVDGLLAYNEAQTGDASCERLTLVLRDASGDVVGGLLGEIYWGWLHIDILWIDDSRRSRGYGGKLLAVAEQKAIGKGCCSAFLDTFSFQALSFYEKCGYEVFGELAEFPPGHSRYFLKKSLKVNGSDAPPNNSSSPTA